MLNKVAVRTYLCYLAIPQNDDLVAVADGSETMGDEDARTFLFFQDAVDVL